MTGGLPPNFKLNLTGIKKNANTLLSPPTELPNDSKDDSPKPEQKRPTKLISDDVKSGATLNNKARPGATRPGASLARKNLVIQSSSDESDFDLDLESIPVGKEQPEEPAPPPVEEVDAPVVQVSQLPEIDVDDDDELQIHGEGNKLSIINDLLLSYEMVDEPPEEWSYRLFIKQFANSEASQENANEYDDDDYEVADGSKDDDDDDFDD